MLSFSSPFSWMSLSSQRALCAVLLIAMFGLGSYLSSAQKLLKPVLSNGFVELEAPWSRARAQTLVSELDAANLTCETRRQVMWDSLFLIIYPLALSVTCALLAQALDGQSYLMGTAISWGVLLAAPFDAGENIAMFRMLSGANSALWPHLATICCSIKFALAGGGGLFSVMGILKLIARALFHFA